MKKKTARDLQKIRRKKKKKTAAEIKCRMTARQKMDHAQRPNGFSDFV
jgi:hypothetical protein